VGERETVDVDRTGGNVTLDTVEVTANRTTNGTVNVTASSDPLPDSPAFDVSTNTRGLGYFRIEHSAPNEDFSNATLTFRIDRSAVRRSDAAPEDVAMYRYTDGRWVAQPTTFLGLDGDLLRYRTTADGLSEWVAGTNRPEISITNASVSVEASQTSEGDRARIDARITNNGEADGVYVTRLLLGEEVLDERRVTVPDGGTVQVTFDRSFDTTGSYTLTVNTVTAGVIEVSDSGTIAVREAGDSVAPLDTTTATEGPLLPSATALALAALCLGVVTRLLSRRN